MKDFDEDYSLLLKDENGQETNCNILAIIKRQGENPIIVYTDYTLDKENKYKIIASQVIKNGDSYSTQIIDNPKDVVGLSEELNKIYEEIAKISKEKDRIEKIFLDSTKTPMVAVKELIKEYKKLEKNKKNIFILAIQETIRERLEEIKKYQLIKSDSDKKEIKKLFDDIKNRLALLSEIQKDNFKRNKNGTEKQETEDNEVIKSNLEISFKETYNSIANILRELGEKETKKILLNKLKNIYEKLLINLQAANSGFLRKKENELLKLAGKENKVSRDAIIKDYIKNIKEEKYDQNKLLDLIHTRDRYIAILEARIKYSTDKNQSEIDIEKELQEAIKKFYTDNFGEIVEREQYLPLIDGRANPEQIQNNQSGQENDDDKKDQEAYEKANEEYEKAKKAYEIVNQGLKDLEEQINNAPQEAKDTLTQKKVLQEKELEKKNAELFRARGRLISISKVRYKKAKSEDKNKIKKEIYELLKDHITNIEENIKSNKNRKDIPAYIEITSEFVWKIQKLNAAITLSKYADAEQKENNLSTTIKNIVSPIGTLLKVPIIVPLKLGSKALSTIGQIVVQPIDMIYTPIGKVIHFDSKYNTQKIQAAGKRLGEILATPTNALESVVRKK